MPSGSSSGGGSASSKRGYFALPSIRTISDIAISAVDKVADERTRKNAYNAINTFCRERPVLASFITLQLLFSLLPILFFTIFTLSITSFCLLAAISVILFWTGIALFVTFCIVSLTSMFAAGCWCYFAGCWWVSKVVAGYLGLIDIGDSKKGKEGVLVRRVNGYGNGYGYEYGNGPGNGSENGEGVVGKKVVFDVKTEEDVKHNEEEEEDKVQNDNGVNGTVEVKKEEGVDGEHAVAADPTMDDIKVEEDKHRQVREESPSQHSEGDYLDIRRGGSG